MPNETVLTPAMAMIWKPSMATDLNRMICSPEAGGSGALYCARRTMRYDAPRFVRMFRRFFMKRAVLLLSLLVVTPLLAESTLSNERLARIDRLFQRYVDENRIGGAVALVLQDGRPVYERAFGWSDKEAGRRMAVDTMFRIASQTKAFTSVAILSLMEEGK